ncbi:MAG: hypothetical protein LBL05_04285, partial [Synergistaceae bacterium]|nr:hypothetical protein [Synergistaceae bacterium]
MFEYEFAVSHIWRGFRQPDERFGNLHLTKEGPYAAEVVMTPVLEQASGFRRDAPLGRIGNFAPCVDILANTIDNRRCAIFLFVGGYFIRAKKNIFLARIGFLFSRLRDWRVKISLTATLRDTMRR